MVILHNATLFHCCTKSVAWQSIITTFALCAVAFATNLIETFNFLQFVFLLDMNVVLVVLLLIYKSCLFK